jgi:hypothetical protein
LNPVADALDATRKELEDTTKTALMQTLSKAAQKVATKQALDVSNTAQLRDICLAAARMFGSDGKDQAAVTVNADKTLIVCDEARMQQLREQRLRLMAAEKPLEGRTADENNRREQKNEATGFDSSAKQKPLQGYLGPVRENPWGPGEYSPDEECAPESDNPDGLSVGL